MTRSELPSLALTFDPRGVPHVLVKGHSLWQGQVMVTPVVDDRGERLEHEIVVRIQMVAPLVELVPWSTLEAITAAEQAGEQLNTGESS